MKKLAILLALLMSACTLQVNIPPIEIIDSTKTTYDAKEAFGSVGMLAIGTEDDTIAPLGTTFAYNSNILVTAGHVCTTLRVRQAVEGYLPDIWLVYLNRGDLLEKKRGGKVIKVDPVNDLCLVKFKDHGLRPLKIAKFRPVKLGSKAWIVGAPSGFMVSATEGEVMDRVVTGRKDKLNNKLLVSAATTNGHSGSPVLNDKGEVIGVLVMGHKIYDHLSFCTPSSILKKFIKRTLK